MNVLPVQVFVHVSTLGMEVQFELGDALDDARLKRTGALNGKSQNRNSDDARR